VLGRVGAGIALVGDEPYRLLVDSITDYAIFMLTPQGEVASWNGGAQRFKGYAPAEIIGQHFSRFYTPEDKANGLPARALATAANEGRFEGEGWRVRKDGRRFWAHVVIDPVRTANGQLVGYAKITRDLTERRAAEEQLRLSEERFEMMVQSVTDYAIYMLDPQGRVSNWNAGAQRIKGYRPDEIIGQSFERFYTPEDREAGEPQRALAAAQAEGRFEREAWRVRKDGTRFWANVVIDPIRDPGGRLLGYAKVTRDVTEQRETQRALGLAREQLFQAQKMEAIGQLTGGIAHDFNNLLMAVMGSLELLRKRVPDDPLITRLIDNAFRGVERGASLTQRMLAFARRQTLNVNAVAVPELIAGMTDLLQRSLGPQVVIETHFPPDLPAALTDANQLETALLNLALNGRDAMPEGGTITLSARLHIVTPISDDPLIAGTYVVVSVADSGEGMDEETLNRAVEPFFTTKGVGKGTGLGLSMVHGLAQQSGGRLVMHSSKGEGTTVDLYLPAAASAVAPVREAPSAAPAGTGRALLILAVDDDPLVLMNTVAMLEDLGHRVIEAHSGRQALAELALAPGVDLIVTDHAMPQMTGAELAEAVAASHPGLPVLLATGYSELPAGQGGHLPRLSKPFMQKDLADAVARVVPY
jgi:PAS domain S-box-containing protein